MKSKKVWHVIAVVELIIMILAVYFDVFMPTIIIIGIGLFFLLLRKEKLPFHRLGKGTRLIKVILSIFGLSVMWSAFNFGLFLPVLNHLTGEKRDVSTFENLKGNLGLLLFFIIASWTLAAIGEELAYRGFVQNRIMSLFSNEALGMITAVAISSILFSIAHTEQGLIGIIITSTDAIFFSIIKIKYKNLWASVLAHGFMNTIGVVTFYFTGPVYGLW